MATTDGPKNLGKTEAIRLLNERDLLALRKADAELDARMEYQPDPYASEDEEKHAFFIPVWAFALGLLLGLVFMGVVSYIALP